jgi:hypothetical protein
MKLRLPPNNNWSCLPTAFAIVLDIRPEFLIRQLGHDGSEIVRPEKPDPESRRSFHIQELIDYCYRHEIAVTPIEANPSSHVEEGKKQFLEFQGGNQDRMLRYLQNSVGVLTGQSVGSGQFHAVAWNGHSSKVYNPNGIIQTLNDFAINTYWLCHQINRGGRV